MDRLKLSCRRLVQIFGSGDSATQALRGVSLDLTPGELTLIMGPSGCGKTTLLAVLSGLLRPTSGKVMADGYDLYALSEAERREFRRRHVGFIFQGYHLFPTLTIREQLEMVVRWGEGTSAAAAAEQTERLLGLFGLAAKGELFPRELSGGEQQRVAIARALLKSPDLFFADEPTSALDGEHGKQVMEILSEAAHQRGCTVLVVAHDPRALPFADRILHMEDGALKNGESAGETAAANGVAAPSLDEKELVRP